jgi:hypothetical protein
MQAGDIQQGDQLFEGDTLVWTVLWNPQPYDRERIALRLLWAHDQGETDRAYRNEVELNIVRPTLPEDPPADPEDPPVDPEQPPADPDPLDTGENTVTPDPPADEPPADPQPPVVDDTPPES